MAQEAYDVVVLGGGPGGYAAAFRASLLGLRVALVERDKVGGTCLHRGCIPTKALLESAEVYETVRAADAFGIRAPAPEVDWAAVQRAKEEPVRKLHAGLGSLVKHRKVDLIAGEGRCGQRGEVLVRTAQGERSVRGRSVILAPGSYAKTLPGLQADGVRVWTSDHALASDRLPASVAIIGAGAVGMEFASIYRSFGCEVTVIEMLPRVLPAEDAAVSKELAAAYAKRGIAVFTGAKVEDVSERPDGVRLRFTVDGDVRSAEVDTVLVAVGRGPATDGLGLERWGVRTERGFIVIDAEGRAAEGVYAVGDATAGTPQFAHVAFAQGCAAAERIADGRPVDVDLERGVPRAVYCVPEVAAVGLTEEQAREKGYDVSVSTYSFAGNAKAQILRLPRGFAKIVSERGGPILGIHLVGPRVTELLSEALVAVGWEATPADLAAFVHPHPTLSEALGEAALAAIGRPIH